MSNDNQSILTVLDPYASDEAFPPVEIAWDEPDGLLAVGGDLSARRLINAYNSGIFPWFSPEEPIYWWAPDPRAVLYPHKIKFRRSLRKNMRNKGYRITFDHCFAKVVRACAAPRSYTDGTWITPAMYDAYIALHRINIAHSVEIWNSENKLVGGLYGIDTGKIFSGESMFSIERDTSKMAFIALANITQQRGYALIDCQLENPHLFSMGAENISRNRYMKALRSTTILNINSLPVANWKIEVDCVKLSYWQPNGE